MFREPQWKTCVLSVDGIKSLAIDMIVFQKWLAHIQVYIQPPVGFQLNVSWSIVCK